MERYVLLVLRRQARHVQPVTKAREFLIEVT